MTKAKKTTERKPPVWEYSAYRATLKKDGEFFALMTPDGKNALSPEKAKELLDALNGREQMLNFLREIASHGPIMESPTVNRCNERLVILRTLAELAIKRAGERIWP